MASSLISNSLHISFNSVLDALTEFLENGLVRDGMIVSTIQGISVEISEEVFAAAFELPMEGLTDLSEVLKDLVFDARSIFSDSKDQVSTSCKKKEMKIEFRLLGDILAKTIYVKAGSFDAVTHERFLLMTAITCGVKVNWSSLVFVILKDMVTPGSRQEKGYAIQICVLLKNVPGLELGESRAFPSSKILTEKAVHRYVVINEKVGGEEVSNAPRVKKTPVKKAASKKRPATDAAAKPVVKRKRTTKSKSVSSKETLDILPVEAVPLQIIAPIPVSPAEQPPVPKRKNQRKRRLILGSDDEIVDSEPVFCGNIVGEAAVEVVDDTAEKDVATVVESVDEPVSLPAVAYVLNEGISMLMMWILSLSSDTDEEIVTVDVETEAVEQSTDEAMSLEDIFMTILVECPLPSAKVEITKITLGKSISIPGVNEGDWYKAGLPKIPETDKLKVPLMERDPVKGNPVKEQFSLIIADIEILVQLREQIIDDVDRFFNSFSLKKLANLKIDESYFDKEALILSWAGTDTTRVALNRKMYILTKYRELLIRKVLEARKLNFVPSEGSSATDLKILEKLFDFHMVVVEDLKEQKLAHGLKWEKTCCSKIFEGRPRDRGAIIARTNTNTRSTFWIRTMISVDGIWVIEPCGDHWVTIPREVVNNDLNISHRSSQTSCSRTRTQLLQPAQICCYTSLPTTQQKLQKLKSIKTLNKSAQI
ncbi:hypothetical protein F511_18357 [Dorcoceras hygrometricum]|uniref:Uncharacterized protein n=1 Tax=Dorcoceras hygrometricum TaxID=472368 RepID=A0A2Z7BXU6_9LAMI|nr:hypothetical protein F511_18357 [Dorcoceras hygrometricum]